MHQELPWWSTVRLHAPSAGGTWPLPGWGSKIPGAMRRSQKSESKKPIYTYGTNFGNIYIDYLNIKNNISRTIAASMYLYTLFSFLAVSFANTLLLRIFLKNMLFPI